MTSLAHLSPRLTSGAIQPLDGASYRRRVVLVLEVEGYTSRADVIAAIDAWLTASGVEGPMLDPSVDVSLSRRQETAAQ